MAGMNLVKKFHPLCDVPAFGGLRHVSGLPLAMRLEPLSSWRRGLWHHGTRPKKKSVAARLFGAIEPMAQGQQTEALADNNVRIAKHKQSCILEWS